MTEHTIIQARLDLAIRDEAAAVLESIGLTIPEAVELMLSRVARDKALPFDLFEPNEITVAAMTEARERRGLRRAQSVEALMADLNAEDD